MNEDAKTFVTHKCFGRSRQRTLETFRRSTHDADERKNYRSDKDRRKKLVDLIVLIRELLRFAHEELGEIFQHNYAQL